MAVDQSGFTSLSLHEEKHVDDFFVPSRSVFKRAFDRSLLRILSSILPGLESNPYRQILCRLSILWLIEKSRSTSDDAQAVKGYDDAQWPQWKAIITFTSRTFFSVTGEVRHPGDRPIGAHAGHLPVALAKRELRAKYGALRKVDIGGKCHRTSCVISNVRCK